MLVFIEGMLQNAGDLHFWLFELIFDFRMWNLKMQVIQKSHPRALVTKFLVDKNTWNSYQHDLRKKIFFCWNIVGDKIDFEEVKSCSLFAIVLFSFTSLFHSWRSVPTRVFSYLPSQKMRNCVLRLKCDGNLWFKSRNRWRFQSRELLVLPLQLRLPLRVLVQKSVWPGKTKSRSKICHQKQKRVVFKWKAKKSGL